MPQTFTCFLMHPIISIVLTRCPDKSLPSYWPPPGERAEDSFARWKPMLKIEYAASLESLLIELLKLNNNIAVTVIFWGKGKERKQVKRLNNNDFIWTYRHLTLFDDVFKSTEAGVTNQLDRTRHEFVLHFFTCFTSSTGHHGCCGRLLLLLLLLYVGGRRNRAAGEATESRSRLTISTH